MFGCSLVGMYRPTAHICHCYRSDDCWSFLGNTKESAGHSFLHANPSFVVYMLPHSLQAQPRVGERASWISFIEDYRIKLKIPPPAATVSSVTALILISRSAIRWIG